jgi:putative chitinase
MTLLSRLFAFLGLAREAEPAAGTAQQPASLVPAPGVYHPAQVAPSYSGAGDTIPAPANLNPAPVEAPEVRTRVTPALLLAVGASPTRASLYAPLLDAAVMVDGDPVNSITSRNGVCMLVAQIAHESGGFASITENLNYTATALLSVFGSHRITQAEAQRIGRTADHAADQQAIANVVYGGAWGRAKLGNTEPGDGWRFRGGGLIQLTGRSNYTAFGDSLGVSAEGAADYVRTSAGAVASALWFWRTRGLINPAYLGDVSTCTRIINGGLNGLQDRLARFQAAKGAV